MRYIRRPRQRRGGDWIGPLEVREGANLFVPDPTAALAAAEGKLAEPPSSVPDHACGHRLLGCVEILTKRAPQGVAECGRALELDRILASAPMPLSDLAKFSSVAPKRQIVGAALRLSPSDTNAHTSKSYAGYAKTLLGRL